MATDRGPLRRAVDLAATKGRASRTDADGAALALARHYADLMDRAELLARVVVALWDPETGLPVGDMDARKQLAALSKLVEAQQVANDLGPKLLAALAALLLTPAARSTVKGGKADERDPAAAALTLLRGGQHGVASRANHAPAVHPPTT